jgi:hypothetical protein
LDLSSTSLTEGGCLSVVQALKTNQAITTLNLSDNELGDRAWEALADALDENRSITSLTIREAVVEAGIGMQKLAQKLASNPTLTNIRAEKVKHLRPIVSYTVRANVDAVIDCEDDRGNIYSAFHISVQSLVNKWTLAKRYSEFSALYYELCSLNDPVILALEFPPKKWTTPTPASLERRRAKLHTFVEMSLARASPNCQALLHTFLDVEGQSEALRETLDAAGELVSFVQPDGMAANLHCESPAASGDLLSPRRPTAVLKSKSFGSALASGRGVSEVDDIFGEADSGAGAPGGGLNERPVRFCTVSDHAPNLAT